jgi:methionyl-tRNA formyltransferase
MKIMFMGTPDFAVSSLRALCEAGFDVASAVTQADSPKGRGYRLAPPPVKEYALSHGIPVYQPATLRGPEFSRLLTGLAPDLIAVAAYGKILPHSVIGFPAFGCVNVHGSLLPEYRGAAPMQRAIIDGRSETGVTTMMMDDGLDTGDVLLSRSVPIGPDDDFGTVHDRLAEAGGELLVQTIEEMMKGTLVRRPQSGFGVAPTYAKKIEKSDCLLDFSSGASPLHDLIRGLSPSPLAFTRLPGGRQLKVIRSAVGADSVPAVPGTVTSVADGAVEVACGPEGTGRILLLGVLPEGRGRMSAADFIRGRGVAAGDVLGGRPE